MRQHISSLVMNAPSSLASQLAMQPIPPPSVSSIIRNRPCKYIGAIQGARQQLMKMKGIVVSERVYTSGLTYPCCE